MISQLNSLFQKLGYTEQNGLFVLEESYKKIQQNFPYRVSRILTEIIKPYAIFSQDNCYTDQNHVKPFNTPLILFYDNPSKQEYEQIARHSFNLSRAPIVIVSNDDKQTIDIFNGFNFSEENPNWLELIDVNLDVLSLKNLRNGSGWNTIYQKYFKRTKTVDRYLLSNITDARRILVAQEENFPSGNLLPEVANRLIGRLIFVRYLIDRNVSFSDQNILVGKNKEERQQALNGLLQNKKELYDFFEYITSKFQGDLFPMNFELNGTSWEERDYVKKENLDILYYLFTCSDIFAGQDIKGYTVQPSLFNKYDFEIIPVELISNIYESFLGSNDHAKAENLVTKLSKQKKVKAYYTPPFLVDYVLSQTVNPFLDRTDSAACKVLDPSCGSGIFLVETLRQIIEKEIETNKIDDNNHQISNERLWELLRNNIYGIDIDSSAIEITTFSLYITLLDYKQLPKEIENFQFQPIRETNLFGGENADFFNTVHEYNDLFSINIKLDFIIGNPPWGHVDESIYIDYLKKRKKSENEGNKDLDICLEVGNKEISQWRFRSK